MSQAPLLHVVICCAAFLLAAGTSLLPLAPAPAPGPGPEQEPEPELGPNCPDRCGDLHIPYPFGVGPECSLPGFDLTCNETTSPPSLLTRNLEIANITLETAQMVVYVPLIYSCVLRDSQNNPMSPTINNVILEFASPFLLSPVDNVFTGVGCSLIAVLRGQVHDGDRIRRAYPTGCVSACARVNDTGEDEPPCHGYGCCEAPITPGLSQVFFFTLDRDREFRRVADNWCQYAFVAAKGWYKYNKTDLTGNMTFAKKVARSHGIPLVLDWAIRNRSCPPAPLGGDKESVPYGACISTHSNCVNASSGASGYFCNCSQGYAGNPYIPNGCTNINECERKDPFPCSTGSTCHDEIGDYKCICHFGRRGDGKRPNGCEAILSVAAIAVIGTISAMALLAVLLIFLHMKREKRKLRDHFNENGGQLLKSIKIEIFTEEKLKHITKNYYSSIGEGAFGKVYKGTTEDGTRVAVKRSIAVNKDRQKDFANEITIQSQISHRNLVQLLGCCLETEAPMLVYEFVPRGSLHDVLHDKRDPLPLETRMNIAINSANALAYMHSQASQKILHGDVKSGNILLDDGFMPKVSDFGTSRLMSIDKDHTNWIIGDSSYIDPVYMKTGLLTEKSDVYSFGIVLLELITRKKARYAKNNSLPINYIKASIDGTTKEMYDADIIVSGAEEDVKCLEEVGLVAVQCLEDDVNDRPTMSEVVEKLKMCERRWFQSRGQDSEVCT